VDVHAAEHEVATDGSRVALSDRRHVRQALPVANVNISDARRWWRPIACDDVHAVADRPKYRHRATGLGMDREASPAAAVTTHTQLMYTRQHFLADGGRGSRP